MLQVQSQLERNIQTKDVLVLTFDFHQIWKCSIEKMIFFILFELNAMNAFSMAHCV